MQLTYVHTWITKLPATNLKSTPHDSTQSRDAAGCKVFLHLPIVHLQSDELMVHWFVWLSTDHSKPWTADQLGHSLKLYHFYDMLLTTLWCIFHTKNSMNFKNLYTWSSCWRVLWTKVSPNRTNHNYHLQEKIAQSLFKCCATNVLDTCPHFVLSYVSLFFFLFFQLLFCLSPSFTSVILVFKYICPHFVLSYVSNFFPVALLLESELHFSDLRLCRKTNEEW